jgi:hypothetical protein
MPGRRPPSTISFEHKPGTACKEARYHRRCAGRWRGIIELAPTHDGKRVRKKVSAGTRAEVEVKLEAVRVSFELGQILHADYPLPSVQSFVADWGTTRLAKPAVRSAKWRSGRPGSLLRRLAHSA